MMFFTSPGHALPSTHSSKFLPPRNPGRTTVCRHWISYRADGYASWCVTFAEIAAHVVRPM